ncbi:hypothetical protein ACLKA7_005094 [Drosophila subpalustris]
MSGDREVEASGRRNLARRRIKESRDRGVEKDRRRKLARLEKRREVSVDSFGRGIDPVSRVNYPGKNPTNQKYLDEAQFPSAEAQSRQKPH